MPVIALTHLGRHRWQTLPLSRVYHVVLFMPVGQLDVATYYYN